MKKTLRTLANGQQCLVRIPDICCWDASTTVLAHIRRAGNAGVGQKPPDICGVFACRTCHDEIDRRTRKLTMDVLNDYILDALCRQLAWYDKHEVITVVL
jgi:hypothetical protein